MAGRGDEDMPRDAKIVQELLKSMNVDDYEPRVVHQYLEFWYRYVVDVLTDAQVYSEHAGKSTIDSDDVKLAIQSKVNFSFSQPPPREAWNVGCSKYTTFTLFWYFQITNLKIVGPNSKIFVSLSYISPLKVLLELAKSRNKVPLPKSIAGVGGIPLPPEQDTLISPNYQLAIPRKQNSQPPEETEDYDEEAAADPDPNPNPNSNPNPSQERRDLPQGGTPQRVSFSLGDKRPR